MAAPETTSARRAPAVEDRGAPLTAEPFGRLLPWLLLVGGLLGAAAAGVLTVEKLALLADPTYVPSCSINPVLSCGSIMRTAQAEVLGFPNPLLGLAGFPVVAATGAALLGGARLARWYWLGLQLGLTVGVLFAHWLVFQSLYRIGALCPYCMLVWAVTIVVFTYVTLTTLSQASLNPALRRAVDAVVRQHATVVTVWLLGIVALCLVRFWDYWTSLVA